MTSLPLLDHLYTDDREQFVRDLLTLYHTRGSAIVNFLYFSSAMHYRLFERHRSARELAYKQALLAGDFLLADGIALQVYKWATDLQRVDNLNGTDLTPWLLAYLTEHYSVSLYVYSVYDPGIDKDSSWLEKGLDALLREYPTLRIASSHQSLYTERGEDFPHEQFEKAAARDDSQIKIFLHCTGTPFQEIWTETQRDWLAEQGMLTLNVGGFLDFVSGFEKRAPERAIKARVLETPYRIISRPRKNFQKFVRMFGILRVWKNQLVNSLTCFFSKN